MKPDVARRAAEQLLALTKMDKTKLEGRLDAGTLTGLQEDIRLLSTSTASALTSRVQRKAATETQNKTAKKLAALVKAEAAMGKVIAAAELEFVENLERLKQYRAVIPARPKPKKTPKPA